MRQANGSWQRWIRPSPQNRNVARLAVLLRGLDLTLDEERPGDEVVTCKGRRVLVTDADTAAKCADRTLDYSSEQMSHVGGGHTRPPAG